jgi:hypothetical protein
MKEYIKIGKETITANIGSSFLDILSLDTNFIKKEIIEKTNFNDLTEIKKAYKKVHKLQPLLFIDKFDLIEYLNDFNNSKKILKDYNNSIEQLTSLINFQKNINNNNELLSELTKNLKYLKQRKKNYLKLTNNLPKYINNVFSIIITQIE